MQPERVPGYCFWGPYFSVRPSRLSSALRYRLRSAAGCLAVLVSDLLSSATTRGRALALGRRHGGSSRSCSTSLNALISAWRRSMCASPVWEFACAMTLLGLESSGVR